MAFVTPVVEHWLEREIAQWVHEGSIRRPIAPWANALPLSYVPLCCLSFLTVVAIDQWGKNLFNVIDSCQWRTGIFKNEIISHTKISINKNVLSASFNMEWDVAPWYSVHSWHDGSSDRSLMVDPLSYFLFQPVLRYWYNKSTGACYPVCGMVYIKESLLLIGKSSPCSGGSMSPVSLSGPLPYVWCHITINKMCWMCR